MNKIEYSVKSISQLLDKEDEMLLYGQLLDNFYSAKTDNEKLSLIIDEPEYNEQHIVFLCMLAGTVEKLAKNYNLPIPEWVNEDKYVMKNIYYAFDTQNPEFQKYLSETTPDEYKKRNIMVGESMLERC